MLTQREREVASLAMQGFTVTNVAARLGLSEPTVKTHLRHIYRKLGVSTRAQLACRLLVEATAAPGVPSPPPPGPGAGPLVPDCDREVGRSRCCWNCRHYVRPRCRPEALLEGPPVSVCTAGATSTAGSAGAPPRVRVDPGLVCPAFEDDLEGRVV